MILGVFDIRYIPHTSIKGQVLADLVAKFAEPSLKEEAETQDMDEKSVGASLYKGPHAGKYILMAQRTKGASE